MTTHLKPADAAQALEAVRWAISEEAPLELVGHGTKRALGRPFQATHTLDMSDLTGVYRALSFIGLGLVLVGIGWLYQRLLFPPPKTQPAPVDPAPPPIR